MVHAIIRRRWSAPRSLTLSAMEEIMSIVVWIKNDTDKKIVEEFDCLYCQEENHQSECPVCQGAGKLTKARSQYFMNLANSSFCDLWTKLRIPFDDGDGSLCGEISALKLTKAIQNCNDQFNHSLQKLNEISQRAFQMGEDILWG
jgi:hypothetical protein